jgi:transcriptional regulator with XRE-family HTH domain
MTLGERILVLRHRLKMSQNMLGKATGIDKNTIARLERGEMHELSSTRIVRLAKALGVSTDVLLGVVNMDSKSESLPTELATAGNLA